MVKIVSEPWNTSNKMEYSRYGASRRGARGKGQFRYINDIQSYSW